MSLSQRSLSHFIWTGIDEHGVSHTGRYTALEPQEVRAYLQQRHIRLLTVQRQSMSRHWYRRHTIQRHDISLWTRQMATLLESGLSLSQALELLQSHQKKPAMRSLLYALSESLASGETLSHTLRAYRTHFDALYINLIESAEYHGKMAEVFTTLSQYRERSDALKRQIIKAALYPLLVLCVALIVTYLMLVMVIPEFEQLFASFDAQLPAMTQAVIASSAWLKQWGEALIVLTMSVVGGGYSMMKRSSRLHYVASYCLLRCPFIGNTIKRAALARFCQTTATCLAAGLPILKALHLGAKSTGNAYLSQQFAPIIERTASGHPIYRSLTNRAIFSYTFIQLITIGEESGQLDEMLHKISRNYQQAVQRNIEGLEKMLEPVLILMIGTLIGGLIIAMYLPIFNLAGILS
ncbi:type II secretion system F family protein [Vibrio zhugei]|uniref:Type II secretion system F family protein n=1 Tax=Vibrio zhugei TaxID=2479546 RepID=A0ABV7CB62_9VIBR|nr:type II secretion system F family protein [Vibrio zhugei]